MAPRPSTSPDRSGRDAEQRRSEHRWPVLVALAGVLVLNLVVSSPETAPTRYVALALIVALSIPLVILNPMRLDKQTTWSKWTSISLALVLTVSNQVNVVVVIRLLLDGTAEGGQVLLTAVQVWVTNVVAFSLVYWELDRGGPVARGTLPRASLPAADFAFPQDDLSDAVAEVATGSSEKSDWRPAYVDYFYLAITNMTAFSPTDVMPLTSRAKMLMALQGLTGFVLLALVISRAVNIIG